jgi:hypothetical protein
MRLMCGTHDFVILGVALMMCDTIASMINNNKIHEVHEVARNLAPLDLVHSDLCEMNGLLTRGSKRYFMTLSMMLLAFAIFTC